MERLIGGEILSYPSFIGQMGQLKNPRDMHRDDSLLSLDMHPFSVFGSGDSSCDGGGRGGRNIAPRPPPVPSL